MAITQTPRDWTSPLQYLAAALPCCHGFVNTQDTRQLAPAFTPQLRGNLVYKQLKSTEKLYFCQVANDLLYNICSYFVTPHAAVMRKPLPGQPAKEKPSPLDNHLSPIPKAEIQSDTQISQRQQNVNSPKKPTKPHYTLKYRSFIDLQDFRCSRDSAQSPRPKEIVITIDLPLLRSVADADLDVTERLVSLESKKPAYRLEVPMAYPVDENKGEAKFNKQKKQLVVTLPVLPLKEPTVAEVSGRQLVNDDGEEDFENRDSSEDVHSGNATSLRSENQLISVLEDKIEFSEQSGDIEEDKQHKLKSGESHQAKASKPTEFDGKTGFTDQNEGQSDDNNLHDEDKQKTVQFSEHVQVAQSQEEDDLPAEQTFQDCNMRPQQVLLTEINHDGQELVICDHTTSAGFVFQNSFIYDLD
ncbi:unnamed protein product [Oncorhynchus mykiss]|uniref:PIH1D1/2/3 CS-like domain-containing protein n=1 Tax=Oncorhynchus mykiss TaxID=8022 RepID=A0A060XM04_ONCMY|nr:unnamed protein product [Oncorhynchus mykiss]